MSERVSLELLQYFRIRLREPLTHQRLRELIGSGWNGKLRFRYPEYAVSQVQPYFITHSRVALPEVESRLDEVNTILEDPAYQGRLWYLMGYSHKRWERIDEEMQDRGEERLAMREIEETLEDFYRGEGDFQQGHSLRVIFLEGFFSVCGGIFLTS